MSKRKDIRGIIYNNLLPLRHIDTKNTHAVWKCKCLKCGKATYVTYSNIVNGNSKSCASCGQKKLSKEQEKEVAKRYLDGEKIVDLAKMYNVSNYVIRGVLKRKNIKTDRHKKIKDLQKKEIQKRYDDGEAIISIAKSFCVDRRTIKAALSE